MTDQETENQSVWWLPLAAASAAGLLAAIVWGLAQRELPDEEPPPPGSMRVRLEKLNPSAAAPAVPALASDGSAIVFEDGGELHRSTGGTIVNLTASFEEQAYEPALSPDLSLLAFAASSGIWLMPAAGGAPRLLTDAGHHPAWSPSGLQLAVVSRRDEDTTSTTNNGILSVITVEDGSRADLELPHSVRGASWSPAGTELVYWTAEEELWITELNGESRPLLRADRAWSAVWAADGAIRYLTDASGVMGIWSIEGERRSALTRAPLGAIRSLGSTPDGSKLVFDRTQTPSTVYQIGFDPTRGITVGERSIVARHRGLLSNIDLSPSGRLLVYEADGDISLLSLDDGNTRALTTDHANDSNPSFIDDETVLFVRNHEAWRIGTVGSALTRDNSNRPRPSACEAVPSREYQLCVAAASLEWRAVDGSDITPISVQPGEEESPTAIALSADARTLFYVQSDQVSEVWTMELQRTEVAAPVVRWRHLGHPSERPSHLSFSPKGEHVAYVLDGAIYLQETSGRRRVRLTEGVDPAFSPDGQTIAFARPGDGLYVMGATGESPRRLLEGGFDPAWSPDGARLLFNTAPQRQDLSFPPDATIHLLEDLEQGGTTLVGPGAGAKFSPNGRHVAFWSAEKEIFTVKLGDPKRTRIDTGGPGWSPLWGPDGDLYYVGNKGGTTDIWRWGDAPVQITAGLSDQLHAFDLAPGMLIIAPILPDETSALWLGELSAESD